MKSNDNTKLRKNEENVTCTLVNGNDFKESNDENNGTSSDNKGNATCNVKDEDAELVLENDDSKAGVSDGRWGWIVVLGCVLLRVIIGGIGRSAPIFYVKFLERFNGTAAQTAWVTSLGATTRLLVGPIVSVLCNRFSCRKLVFIGAVLYVIALHVSGYATSLTYLYMSYGVLGGIGRSFLLTPCTILLSQYFSEKASLAFGLASSGFGLGGFFSTPAIEVLFQTYGFVGTYILLSGVACHLFICVTVFRPPARQPNSHKKDSIVTADVEDDLNDDGEQNEGQANLISIMSSTGSVHLVHSRTQKAEMEPLEPENVEFGRRRKSSLRQIITKLKPNLKQKNNVDNEKKKWISFSILKDVRFLTLCFATFLFSVPSSGVFFAALARERGVSDFESAYLLSITAGCDTCIRVVSGFVMDRKRVRPFRSVIYNITSFLQGVSFFLIPQARTFWQFAVLSGFRGSLMGLKAAQRNVVLLDILGVNNLPSSFAYLLTIQGIGTLVGPPVSGFLKDNYGKYDYAYYFGGVAVLLGSLVLAYGNIRNWHQNRRKPNSDGNGREPNRGRNTSSR